jgi:hypothetical protein
MVGRMKRAGLALVVLLAAALPAEAACYADYKAKRDNPLRLHYGVMELPESACTSRATAEEVVRSRLGPADWQLMNVVGLFGDEGLEERRESAGDFFLRF